MRALDQGRPAFHPRHPVCATTQPTLLACQLPIPAGGHKQANPKTATKTPQAHCPSSVRTPSVHPDQPKLWLAVTLRQKSEREIPVFSDIAVALAATLTVATALPPPSAGRPSFTEPAALPPRPSRLRLTSTPLVHGTVLSHPVMNDGSGAPCCGDRRCHVHFS